LRHNGYIASDEKGSIPIKNILEAIIDSAEGKLLSLVTERCRYEFRSKQTGEVKAWQDAIMNASPPGAMQYMLKMPEIGGGIYKKNFWEVMGANTDDTKRGGIPFGVRQELVTEEQDILLHNLFDLIKAQDVVNLKKEYIEDQDLARFVGNRMPDTGNSTNTDPAKQPPTMQNCSDAVEEAIILHEGDGDGSTCGFEDFKAAICAQRSQDNPNGSEMARIIELAMQGQKSDEVFESAAGEMSVGQKLYEYHKFMNKVLGACRDGDDEVDGKGADKVSLTKVVAESYTNNIVREVEMLIQRHNQYQERLRTLQPSLRARTQHQAIDDIFDSEMLPGERWVG